MFRGLLTTITLSLISASLTSLPVRNYDFLGLHRVTHSLDKSIDLQFTAFNKTYSLKLDRNLHLLLADSVLHLHDSLTGKVQKHSIVAHPYQGVLVDENGLEIGWSRILFHQDPYSTPTNKLIFDGSFANSEGTYHISTVDNYRNSRRPGQDISIVSPLSRDTKHRNSNMIIFKDVHDSDFKNHHLQHLPPTQLTKHYGCGFDPTMTRQTQHVDKRRTLVKRQSPSNCVASVRKIMQMVSFDIFSKYKGVAADCTYTQNYGGPAATLNRIISNWNQASAIYEQTFNIQLAIIEVKIMQGCGDFNGESLPWNKQCTDPFTINNRLSAFSQWRSMKAKDSAGLWHLMSKCNSGPTVGIAWLGEICNTNAAQQVSGGVTQFVNGAGVSTVVPTEWKVVAHEIGHNFGAIHDCTSDLCPSTCDLTNPSSCSCCPCGSTCDCKGQFLMNPTDNSALSSFSPCSISLMCSGIIAKASCLVSVGSAKIISLGVCGNGVVETGEDCDCGAGCTVDNCCDGATCKFKGNAKCDDRVDECCSSCQPKPAGTICRPSEDFCTASSKCTGNSGICTTSVIQADGTGCSITNRSNTTGTTCASGICTSRKLQCQSLISTGSFQTTDACTGMDYQCTKLCSTASGTCLSMSGNFIDGTPCIGGGQCKNGACQGSNLLLIASFFFQTQPQVAYPVAISASIILISMAFCCFRCICRRKAGKPVIPKSVDDKLNSMKGMTKRARRNSHSSQKPLVRDSANSPISNSAATEKALPFSSLTTNIQIPHNIPSNPDTNDPYTQALQQQYNQEVEGVYINPNSFVY